MVVIEIREVGQHTEMQRLALTKRTPGVRRSVHNVKAELVPLHLEPLCPAYRLVWGIEHAVSDVHPAHRLPLVPELQFHATRRIHRVEAVVDGELQVEVS